MIDLQLASQRPTLEHLPPDIVDFTIGDIAVDAAAEFGLDLYDWQAWCLRHILARRADGNWAARESCLEVPRQNGKNSIIEALELYLVFFGGARLVVHSAHEQITAEMHFKRLRELIKGSDELMDQMPSTRNQGFATSNGKEAITLRSGAQISFRTRTKRTGRGPSPDAIVFDEAMVLTDKVAGVISPSVSARKKALLVFTSSSPDETSETLWRQRKRALKGDTGRLFYAAWNSSTDVDPADEDNWFKCNPSLEISSDERPCKQIEAIRADLQMMSPEMFAIEHLGIPGEQFDASAHGPINLDTWSNPVSAGGLTDAASTVTAATAQVAADKDSDWYQASVAGERPDGLHHVGSLAAGMSKADFLAELNTACTELGVKVVTLPKGSPAEALAADLATIGLDVYLMPQAEQALAFEKFVNATKGAAPMLRHRGEPKMRTALEQASTKPWGDGGQMWSRRAATGDIAPLTAPTMAYGRIGADVQADPLSQIW